MRKTNSLIKRSGIIKILKKSGIKRFNNQGLALLERKLKEKAILWAKLLSQRLALEGRKTLKERDIKIIDEIEKKEKISEFEV